MEHGVSDHPVLCGAPLLSLKSVESRSETAASLLRVGCYPKHSGWKTPRWGTPDRECPPWEPRGNVVLYDLVYTAGVDPQ